MKENSIERDIHLLESYAGMTRKMNDNQGRPKLDQAIEHLLSDYKRVLKENELLRKDIESWKKYCEEIEEERTETSNKNCELEFEIEKLQKGNEKLKNNYINIQDNSNTTFWKVTPPPEPQLPTKTLCESFSKKKSK